MPGQRRCHEIAQHRKFQNAAVSESVAQAAVRETLEETGIECAVTGTVGIYSDPRHVILYTSNGEVRQESRSC